MNKEQDNRDEKLKFEGFRLKKEGVHFDSTDVSETYSIFYRKLKTNNQKEI